MTRRPGAVDAMLVTTVLLWSLSVIGSRFAIAHGFPPIVFSATRQLGAASALAAICGRLEGSLRLPRFALSWVAVAALLGFANQLCFVYAVRLSTAATVGMMLGTVPILTALMAAALGFGPVSRRLAVAAAVSFAGVALVTSQAGEINATAAGVALAFLTALSWAAYSVAIARLGGVASPLRISAFVMLAFTPPLLASASIQLTSADYGALDWSVWACVAGVAAGTVLSTLMWFTALERVGPSHATLFANLQPVFVVALSVLLLSERLSPWMLAGGAAIAAGLALARRTRHAAPIVVD